MVVSRVHVNTYTQISHTHTIYHTTHLYIPHTHLYTYTMHVCTQYITTHIYTYTTHIPHYPPPLTHLMASLICIISQIYAYTLVSPPMGEHLS